MNIYEKMLAVTQEISTVAKNLSVGDGRNQYKAVSEGDVLAAVKPIEAKYGIYSYPKSRVVIDSGEMTSVSTYNGTTKETKRLFLRVETVYRFVNVENPDEWIDITTYGDGVDTQDKAPGKAMTYADKYALLKAYKIQTGDDPDQNYSQPLGGMQRAYPPLSEMLKQIGAYVNTDKSAYSILMDESKRAGVKTVVDLAKANPELIKALWSKWCNK